MYHITTEQIETFLMLAHRKNYREVSEMLFITQPTVTKYIQRLEKELNILLFRRSTQSVELTEENHRQFFIPRGFAHGFSVLSEIAVFQYKCDNFYAPQSEGAIAWDDPDLNIDWRIPADKIILSAKDSKHPLLREI
jgi:dTDP-4-dehydrorhamnose 3,5-epimerase-like enzyme